MEVIISPNDDGRLLVEVLRRRLHVSRGFVRRLTRSGRAEVDGIERRLLDPVYTGERVILMPGSKPNGGVVPQSLLLDLIYDDEHILIVNKPAGIVVHPARKHTDGTLANAIAYHLAPLEQRVVVRPVHRLDSGTSGLIVFARHAHVQNQLSRGMECGLFQRWYLALVGGRMPDELNDDWHLIDAPIARVEGHPVQRCVAPDGQKAQTEYRILERGAHATLVELHLLTGRTHQVRVHMAHLGYPLLGDDMYGGRPLLGRPALHSWRISLIHPILQARLDFVVEPPADISHLTRSLSELLKP